MGVGKRLLYRAGMVVETHGIVEVSHEDVTYILGSVGQCTVYHGVAMA